MTSADASRHGRSTDLPPARPAAAPDGPLTVGSLLRREGRAAHAQDRPVVPRARDLADGGRGSGHRGAVTAGAVLAVTAVLGTNVLGDAAFGPGTGVDDGTAPGPDRPVVPTPRSPLSLAATAAPLAHAIAVLQAAGSPVLAAMDAATPGRAPTSGAGIVAQALGEVPFAVPASVTRDGTADPRTHARHSGDDDRADTHDSDGSSRGRHRSTTTTHRSSDGAGAGDGSTHGARTPPALRIPPVLVDPVAGAPPPATGSGTSAGAPSDAGGPTSPATPPATDGSDAGAAGGGTDDAGDPSDGSDTATSASDDGTKSATSDDETSDDARPSAAAGSHDAGTSAEPDGSVDSASS